jgi:hypothetical protein
VTISVLSSPRSDLRAEYVTALWTLVSIGAERGDPLLDTGIGELQINEQAAHLFDLFDPFLLASWALFAFGADDSVGASCRSF